MPLSNYIYKIIYQHITRVYGAKRFFKFGVQSKHAAKPSKLHCIFSFGHLINSWYFMLWHYRFDLRYNRAGVGKQRQKIVQGGTRVVFGIELWDFQCGKD